MNKLQEAKYEMMVEHDYHRYFSLPEEFRKNTDIVKICFKKHRDSVRKISSIFGEYLKYHETTDQSSLELIIMLSHILTDKQKKAMSFDMYDEIITKIVQQNTFEDLYNTYTNKTVLHYLLDRLLDLYFRSFKFDRSSTDMIILQFLNIYDPILGVYLNENKNILNKYVIEIEKKLTI